MQAVVTAAQKALDGISSTLRKNTTINMNNICCIILGGGQGTRLYPLTLSRCKPAICFGGRYRLIDVPVSNSINSHIQKIFVITQFLASSLHKHLFQTYRQSSFSNGFIEVLAAEQKPEKTCWYQGTADAVRQNLEYLTETPAEYFLILSGDQLYHLQFDKMVQVAMQKEVDVLVATIPVSEKDAPRMGIMKVDENQQIVDFYEKPKEKEILEQFKTPQATLEQMGLSNFSEKPFLASMGIYLFKRDALFALLREDARDDFGKHLIPTKVKQGSIAAFPHNSYWEDIGTIESFHKANMQLTEEAPPFDCYNELHPIYSSRHHLPGPKIYNSHIVNSIICEGSVVEAECIANSLLGQRTMIRKGCVIKDTYVMGNDFYTTPMKAMQHLPEQPYIGENSLILSAIIDKNACIGKNVQLVNKNKLTNFDGKNVFIRDGIIVVPRGARIPDGFTL